MKCGHSPRDSPACDAEAVAKCYWPGRLAEAVCNRHLTAYRFVAGAMGFHLVTRPLEPAELDA